MKLNNRLLLKAVTAAQKQAAVQRQLTTAFNERYGVTYSDANVDEIIDVLDYGHGYSLTLVECDGFMTDAGYPPLK